MRPTVSVIITCFDYGRFLPEALESCFRQTHPSVEIIVVDDASSEVGTREALEQIDPEKVFLIRNRTRQGVSSARNTGIEASAGAFVLPLDADDKLHPSFVEETLPHLEQMSAEVVYTETMLFGIESRLLKLPSFSKKMMLRKNIVVNTALFRKSLWKSVGGYSEKLTFGLEDWDFWLSALKYGARFKKIQKPLFYYRKHGKSRSTLAKCHNTDLTELIRARHPEFFGDIPRELPEGFKKFRWFRSVSTKIQSLFAKSTSAPRSPGKKPVRVHYFNPPKLKNVGDQINVFLLQTLLGRPVRWQKASEATHLCIGSMLEALHPAMERSPPPSGGPIHVWGSGFLAPLGKHPRLPAAERDDFFRPLHLHAVRGKLSLERIRICGVPTEQTVLGDPGLLVGRIFDSPHVQKEFSVGIIPHYLDYKDPRFLVLKGLLKRSTIINVLEPCASVISAIQKCEAIISSSLHGLIFADSFRLPNWHVLASNNLTGGEYKFKDYSSAIDIPHASISMENLIQSIRATPDFVHSKPVISRSLLSNLQENLLNALYRMMDT
jgi:glycosyltransferase involved in cell wall biosynthesis